VHSDLESKARLPVDRQRVWLDFAFADRLVRVGYARFFEFLLQGFVKGRILALPKYGVGTFRRRFG